MAFVALDKEQKELLGVARLAADPDYGKGEYAIIVRSDLKGTGIGWALMRHLIDYAEKEGLRELVGDVLASNERMLDMCRALGFRDRRGPRGYVDPQGAARASREFAEREARRGAGLLSHGIVIARKRLDRCMQSDRQGRQRGGVQGRYLAYSALRHRLSDPRSEAGGQLHRDHRRRPCGDHRYRARRVGQARPGELPPAQIDTVLLDASPLRSYRRSRRGSAAKLARRPLDAARHLRAAGPDAYKLPEDAEGDIFGSSGATEVAKGFAQAYNADAAFRIVHHGTDYLPPEGARMIGHDIPKPGAEEAVTVFDKDGLKIEAFCEPRSGRAGLRLSHHL